MLSSNQTVEIISATGNEISMALELRPVKPPTALGNTLTGADGTITKWCPHGVEQWTSDGINKFWWYKPTLKDIVGSKAQAIYIQFHSDDSVSYKLDGETYYWSAARAAPLCEGTWSWTEYCDNTYDTHNWKPHCSGAHCTYCGTY